MLKITYTTSFKKDFKRVSKQGKNLILIAQVIQKISNQVTLDKKYKDHLLIGNYKGKRELHLAPDWLLIYEINQEENELIIYRTGSHSELFK